MALPQARSQEGASFEDNEHQQRRDRTPHARGAAEETGSEEAGRQAPSVAAARAAASKADREPQ